MGRTPFIVTRKNNEKKQEPEILAPVDYMSGSVIDVVAENSKKQGKSKSLKPKAAFAQKKSHAALREEALATHIPESNIGFKMLQQMGYKAGEGLGKDGSGITNPLDVLVKRNRTGLGVEEELLPQKKQKTELDEEETPVTLDNAIKNFHSVQEVKFKERKVNGQLKASVRICADLDAKEGITSNELLPKSFLPATSEDEGTELEEIVQPAVLLLPQKEGALLKVIEYLRNEYHYCFYCASMYEHKEELDKLCPGITEVDHDGY